MSFMSTANGIAPERQSDIVYSAIAGNSIVSAGLGEGVALLDLRTNQYFSLDDVGALVWQSLQQPQTEADLVRSVTDIYEIDAATCASDIDVLLNDLVDSGLVDARIGSST